MTMLHNNKNIIHTFYLKIYLLYTVLNSQYVIGTSISNKLDILYYINVYYVFYNLLMITKKKPENN